METESKPNGNRIETKWKPNGNRMETKWKPNGNQMETKWDEALCGFDFMRTNRSPNGVQNRVGARKPSFHDPAGAFGDRQNLNREMANPNRTQMGTEWEIGQEENYKCPRTCPKFFTITTCPNNN